MRVGIISVADSTKGLWRDVETLVWMLRHAPVRPGGKQVHDIQIFCLTDKVLLAKKPFRGATIEGATIAVEGVDVATFVDSVDVIISCEILLVEMFDVAARANKRCIYVPNLDWATLDASTDRWVECIKSRPWLDVWAKQRSIQKALANVGIESIYMPWSISDPVVRNRDAQDRDTTRLLVNAGNGGYQGRRGIDLVLKAFAEARNRCDISLTLKTIKPVREYAPLVQHLLDGVDVIEGFSERCIIDDLTADADAVVHVSRWEGFGLPLLEALHAGLPVIATDGWPVGDLIEHGHNGLLVEATEKGKQRLAPIWEVAVNDLIDKMVEIADFELRDRLTCPTPGELVARQHAFLLRARARVFGESEPCMTLVHSPHNVQSRRSERYWEDALKSHGYGVECVAWSEHNGQGLGQDSDFVLVGKPPVEFVKNVRPTAKVLALWHHDSPEYISSWFDQVYPLVDVCFVPYLPANNKHVMLHPGPRSTGDRGPGKRAIERDHSDKSDVVFIGVRADERADLLGHIARSTKFSRYGPGMDYGPVWDGQADAVYCRSKVSLSISRHKGTGRVVGYTSNRLFHATAVGAFVVAEGFPGIVDLYPAGIGTFTTKEEAVTVVNDALADDEGRRRKANIAEKITWRNHTWNDRVHRLLCELANRFGETPVDTSTDPVHPNNEPSWRSYWQERASKHGGRSVAPVAWTADRYAKETERLWNFVKEHAGAALSDGGTNLLDYGCGVGRFSTRLEKEYTYKVIGVDMSPAMVKMAHKAGVDVALLSVGGGIPFDDNTFDALYSFTVLQHVPDDEIGKTVEEIKRTLTPGALIVLVENTSSQFGRTSRSGHVVFRTNQDYVKLFPGLEPIAGIEVAGEHHQLFVGRLT